MTTEQQNKSWASLSKEEREEIKMIFNMPSKYGYPDSVRKLLIDIYGNNLTSDTEPSELLFVERKKVLELYAAFESRQSEAYPGEDTEFWKGNKSGLKYLFGDKCLPDVTSAGNGAMGTTPPAYKLDVKSDKEPSVQVGDKVRIKGEDKVRVVRRILPDGCIMFGDKGNLYSLKDLEIYTEQPSVQCEPKYKVGDKVIVTLFNKVGIVRKIKSHPQIGFNYEVETGKDAYLIVHEVGLEPYTEPAMTEEKYLRFMEMPRDEFRLLPKEEQEAFWEYQREYHRDEALICPPQGNYTVTQKITKDNYWEDNFKKMNECFEKIQRILASLCETWGKIEDGINKLNRL